VSAGRIRVVIADDHGIVREGIRALLASAGDMEVVGEACDGHEAIARCQELLPDVLLLDIAMPNLGGLEAALEVRKDCPATRILVLTQYTDREYVTRFLKIGVSGYVLKRSAGAELAAAIRRVHRGGLVLDPDVAREAVEPGEGAGADDPWDALTDRERQVLRLVAEGKSNKEIASLLAVTVKTAMTHREHMMLKLNLHSRTDVIRFALKSGVIGLAG
jgi:DNA-binding NarL/FixJ family response regulator